MILFKLIVMLILLMITSLNPLTSVAILTLLSIGLMLMSKGVWMSLTLYLILIIFSSGILLMLFYTALIMNNYFNWGESALPLILFWVPLPFQMKMCKFSSLSMGLELMEKFKSMIFLSVVLFCLILLILNLLTLKVKFYRQILFLMSVSA